MFHEMFVHLSPAYHGRGGPFTISHSKTVALTETLIQAGQAAGLPFNEDYNGKTMEGWLHVVSRRFYRNTSFVVSALV